MSQKCWQSDFIHSKQSISLSDYKNKPLILRFWATWCPYCEKLQPKLVELQQKDKASNVKIVAISFNEDDGTLPQNHLTERSYTYRAAVNGDKVAHKYGVQRTPTTFFINNKS